MRLILSTHASEMSIQDFSIFKKQHHQAYSLHMMIKLVLSHALERLFMMSSFAHDLYPLSY